MKPIWQGLDLFADLPIPGAATQRKRIGTCTTIRGARAIAKKNPTAKRFILCGTPDDLDRINGLSHTWTTYFDLVTRNVPLVYEIVIVVKEAT